MGIFDGMAGRYDTEERARIAGIIADELRAQVGDGAELDAIDYGCGTGLVGLRLADSFRSLLLVDASPAMIEQVQEKIARAGLANADTLCADFSLGPPPGCRADIVFMAQVLLHIPDTGNILRRLGTLLDSGGRLLIVDFVREESIPSDRVHNGFIPEELEAVKY